MSHPSALTLFFVLGLLRAGTASAQAPMQSARSTNAPVDAGLDKAAQDPKSQLGAEPASKVDLSDKEIASIAQVSDANPLGRAWYENFDVWGYSALSYLDTGDVGEHPDGGFVIPEASLFLNVHAFEHTLLHVDLQLVPLAHDDEEVTRTGEVYAQLSDLWKNASGDSIGVKAGRIYVPFGEEYTWYRAPDNPLITTSAAFPYGFDEGVEVYGRWHGVDWIAAITDGTEERSSQHASAKSVNFKLGGRLGDRLDLSVSFMHSGSVEESAIELSGSHLGPVGSDGQFSSAGASPSEDVDADLYELDARYQFQPATSLAVSFGQAAVDDDVDAFDRDLLWFSVEPRYQINERLYATLRYSEIGTYDSDEGYHFDGEILAGGNEAFGFDSKRFQRISAGLGWKWNPHALFKLEAGRDRFWTIDASPLDPDSDHRDYIGLEVVVSF